MLEKEGGTNHAQSPAPAADSTLSDSSSRRLSTAGVAASRATTRAASLPCEADAMAASTAECGSSQGCTRLVARWRAAVESKGYLCPLL